MNSGSNKIIFVNQGADQQQKKQIIHQGNSSASNHNNQYGSSYIIAANGPLSTTSKKQSSGSVPRQNNQLNISQVSSGNQIQLGSSQANQFRNSKNRKLYTSIGAYNQSQLPHGMVHQDLLNFPSSGTNKQKNILAQVTANGMNLVEQQDPQNVSNVQSNNTSLVKQNKSADQNSGGARTQSKQGYRQSSSVQGKGKSNKKFGNSSIFVQNYGGTGFVEIGHGQNLLQGQMGMSQDEQMQNAAYSSMLNNLDVPGNIHDVSVLSNNSGGNLGQRPNTVSCANNSMVVDNQIKKKKNNIKNLSNGSVAVNQKNMHGALNSNFAKIGNFVGNQTILEGSSQDQKSNHVVMNSSGISRHNIPKNIKKINTKIMSGNPQVLNQNNVNNIQLTQMRNDDMQQRQRPHSSFKAQTQKQINTFKQQLIGMHPKQKQVVIGNQVSLGPTKQGLVFQQVQNGKVHQIHVDAQGEIGAIVSNDPTSNLLGKSVGSRKNKHQINGGKNKFGGNTQHLNSMSVYQNDLVNEQNIRDQRRIGRTGSGAGTNTNMGPEDHELSYITKEQREIRTSSATAGVTNTEYKLLNETSSQGIRGQNGGNMVPYLINHNLSYNVGGFNGSNAKTHVSALSGTSGNSIQNSGTGNRGNKNQKRKVLNNGYMKSGQQLYLQNQQQMNQSIMITQQQKELIQQIQNSDNKLSANLLGPVGKKNQGMLVHLNDIEVSSKGARKGQSIGQVQFTQMPQFNNLNEEQLFMQNNQQNIINIKENYLCTNQGSLNNQKISTGKISKNAINQSILSNQSTAVNNHNANVSHHTVTSNKNSALPKGLNFFNADGKQPSGFMAKGVLSQNTLQNQSQNNSSVNQNNSNSHKQHQQSMQKFLQQQQLTNFNSKGQNLLYNETGQVHIKKVQGIKGVKNGGSKLGSNTATSKQMPFVLGQFPQNINQNHLGSQLVFSNDQGQGSGGRNLAINNFYSNKQSSQKISNKTNLQNQNLLASDRHSRGSRGAATSNSNGHQYLTYQRGENQTVMHSNKSGALNTSALHISQGQNEFKKQLNQGISRQRGNSYNYQPQGGTQNHPPQRIAMSGTANKNSQVIKAKPQAVQSNFSAFSGTPGPNEESQNQDDRLSPGLELLEDSTKKSSEQKSTENQFYEIEKDQFLEIISNAFDNIIGKLHSKDGGSLNQIRYMYHHYIQQIEQNHQQELSNNSLQIQQLQQCISELQQMLTQSHQTMEMSLSEI